MKTKSTSNMLKKLVTCLAEGWSSRGFALLYSWAMAGKDAVKQCKVKIIVKEALTISLLLRTLVMLSKR